MRLEDVPVPEIYKDSADFRMFIKWFATCLSTLQYDTENLVDLLDPERCPTNLLWMLCDTYGYRYDNRMPPSYNRLMLLYFMSLIKLRGSRNGVTLAAQVNLAQFNVLKYAEENEAYEDRLKDTSIPVNSAYVTSNVELGYIDIVYYSENIPTDTCLEYVRPLGMYCFTHSGVRVDARTKVSIDARLTSFEDMSIPIGPTRVGHYRRADYASLQGYHVEEQYISPIKRNETYYRNSRYEGRTTPWINPGYRSLYSLQLCNNEHIVRSLLPSLDDENAGKIFSIGYGPQDVTVRYPDNYLKHMDMPEYNLRYDQQLEHEHTEDVYTIDMDRSPDILNPRPAVNPIMTAVGDAMAMNSDNTQYTKVDTDGNISVTDV